MMKLFKCDTAKMTLTIVDIPRQNWRVMPPSKLAVTLTLAGIVITAIVWGML